MRKLIQYYFYKDRHNRFAYILFLLCCMIVMIFTDTHYLSDPIVPNTPQNLMGVFMNETADIGIAIIIIAGCYIIFSFTSDLKYRCINFELMSGNSRRKVFLSHYLYMFLFSGSLIVSALVIGTCKYNVITWLNVIWDNKWYFLRTTILMYLVSFSAISICLIFAIIFKDTAKATISTFVFLFLLCYIMAAFAAANSGDSLNAAYDKPAFILLLYPAYMWRWMLNPNLGIKQLIEAGIISIIWCCGIFLISSHYFCRTELK